MDTFAVYISYRRSDSADIAGRLYDRLVARYGAARIHFQDMEAASPDLLVASTVAATVVQSSVMLVIIGPTWLSSSAGWNKRRLDNPGDFVRIEVENALHAHIAVVPVLVGGASMPPANRLPNAIKAMTSYSAIQVRPDPEFQHDLGLVAAAIDYWLSQPRSSAAAPAADGIPYTPPVTPGLAPVTPGVTPIVMASDAPTLPSVAGGQPPTQAMPTEAAIPATTPIPYLSPSNLAPAPAANTPPLPDAPPNPDIPLIGPASDAAPQPLPVPPARRRLPLAWLIVALALVVALISGGVLYGISAINGANALHASNAKATSSAINADNTSTADTATYEALGTQVASSATQTATILAVSYPYDAPAPGPKCDPKNAPWEYAGYSTQEQVTCYADHTHIHGDDDIFTWDPSSQTPPLPEPVNYTISIQFSNLDEKSLSSLVMRVQNANIAETVDMSAIIGASGSIMNGVTTETLAPSVTAQTCTTSACPIAGTRWFNPSATHTMSITINGGHFTFALDGQTIGSVTEPDSFSAPIITFYVGGSVFPGGQQTQGSVDISNFRITPLS